MFLNTVEGCYINTDMVRTLVPKYRKKGNVIVESWWVAVMDNEEEYRISEHEGERFEKYVSKAIVPAAPGMFVREYFEGEEAGSIKHTDHPILAWALPDCHPMTPQHGEFELEEDCCAILYPDGSLYQPWVRHYLTAEAMEADMPAYFDRLRSRQPKDTPTAPDGPKHPDPMNA